MTVFIDPLVNLHPFECNGPGKCYHHDRLKTPTHDPETCLLCDPEYDMEPNPYWQASADRRSGEAATPTEGTGSSAS